MKSIEYDADIKSLKEEILKINQKLDQIISGPVFTSTLTRIGTLDEKCAENLRSLNNMLLQVKGIVAQVNTLRGRKSDWDGDEIKAKGFADMITLEDYTPKITHQ